MNNNVMEKYEFNLPKIENSAYSPFENVVFYPILLNSFSLQISVKDGVAWEKDDNFGWGHFLEHANLQGTDKYESFLHIAKTAETLGARLSAFTNKDSVTYGIHAPSWSLKEAFEIMTSVISHLNFSDEAVEEEKKIVFQEMQRDKSNFKDFASLLTENEILSPNAISRYSLGSEDSVNAISAEKLKSYKQNVYCKKNMSIMLCGGFDTLLAEELTAQMLDSLPLGEERCLRSFLIGKTFENCKYFACPSQSSQLRMIKYFRLSGFSHEQWLTASVLNILLGVGFSCLFYQKLRHEHKLVYTLATQMKLYSKTGLFRFIADLNPESAKLADELISGTFLSLDRISESELNLAKNKYWGDIALKLSDTNQLGNFVSRRFFLDGEIIHLSDIYRSLKSMTLSDIVEFVKNNFKESDIITAFCGSEESLKIVKV